MLFYNDIHCYINTYDPIKDGEWKDSGSYKAAVESCAANIVAALKDINPCLSMDVESTLLNGCGSKKPPFNSTMNLGAVLLANLFNDRKHPVSIASWVPVVPAILPDNNIMQLSVRRDKNNNTINVINATKHS